jgi:penicillin amidase
MANRRTIGSRLLGLAKWALILVALLLAVAAALLWWGMQRSKPALDGTISAPGLEGTVTIRRDKDGVPTLVAQTRRDLAFALGFLHAQERLFQMDTLRRVAAGELSELSGSATQTIDRRIRPHRFRARAKAMVEAMDADERALLRAYVAGVNQGAKALGGAPFEYLITRSSPKPWAEEDTLLAVFAMYLNLQPAVPQRELDRAMAAKAVASILPVWPRDP